MGNIVSEVSYSDGKRKSLIANVLVGKEQFEYKQIQQEVGKLSINGRLANSYMLLKIGEKKSEYIDRQPDLSDPLLDIRDNALKPFWGVIFNNKPLSIISNEDHVPAP